MDPASRLTSRFRTTIPRTVRERLALLPGDTIVGEIEGETVRIRRQAPIDLTWLRGVQATLSEWASPEEAPATDEL